MELDAFTTKLMERTQARREILNKKLSEVGAASRKRRTTLVEEQQIPLEAGDIKEDEGSPSKRQCLDTSSEVSERMEPEKIEGKENIKDDARPETIEDKENVQVDAQAEKKENMTFVQFLTPGSARGLAALKKSKSSLKDDSSSSYSSSDDCKLKHEVVSYGESTNKLESCKPHKSRLSALAADIRSWEEETPSISSTKPFASTDSCINAYEDYNFLNSQKVDFSNTDNRSNIASSIGHKNKSTKHVNFDISNNDFSGDGGNSISEVISNFPSVKSNNCFSKKNGTKINVIDIQEKTVKQQVQKNHVWDQAILTTLESQGFVKSESQSKLSYEFSKCEENSSVECVNERSAKTPVSAGILKQTSENIQPMKLSTIQEKVALFGPKIKSPVKELSGNYRQNSGNTVQKIDPSSIDGAKDPAELPLSARKALFERAFCGNVQKSSENVIEQNLSVAQRAAMFENAVKGNATVVTKVVRKELSKYTGDPISPNKTKNVYIPEIISKSNTLAESKCKGNGSTRSPAKNPCSSSSSNELTSPLRNVGPHTRLIHQRLNNCNDWKNKEIACKTTEERKNEISALVNHWEKVSSSSSLESESVSTVNHEQNVICAQESAAEDDRNLFVFNDYENDGDYEDSISFEEIHEESEQGNEDSNSLFEEDRIDGFSHEKTSSDDEMRISDITGEAVAVCDEMDEILNKALDQSTSGSLTSILPLTQNMRPPSYSSASPSSSQYLTAEQHSSTPISSVISEPITEICESDSETPLLHTVSFYRRQKQELKLTPVRSIVRREQVISPPSPETNKTFDIQGKIKALHDEVLSQQTVISQTSQALNLCHSTAEFFGSTEQVEGERLLLIATQKRQIFLNEMQRLKTLGSKGQSIEEGTGTLTLDDIRLPLKREFVVSQLEGKGSETIHYFLCLVRFGAQVVFTQMLSTKDDISSGCLSFTNHITLQNLPADFSVAFEVYTLQTKVQMMPHDKKYHIRKDHSKLRLTPKGKKSDTKLLTPVVCSPGGPNAVRTPNFSVVGFTRFTLQNCSRKTYTMEKVPFASPLEGIVQLNIQLHAEHNISEHGFLTMFEDVSGFGAWHRRWCVLDSSELAYWKYPDDERKKKPLGIIDLTKCITSHVRLVSRDVCARPHTFQIATARPQMKGDKNTLISMSVNTVTTTKHLLSADTKEERILWCNKLNEALTNVRKWNPHALCPMEYNKQEK